MWKVGGAISPASQIWIWPTVSGLMKRNAQPLQEMRRFLAVGLIFGDIRITRQKLAYFLRLKKHPKSALTGKNNTLFSTARI
jgi:hypothetical protein